MANKANSIIYKELAFKIICKSIEMGKLNRPDVGLYHLVSIDIGLKRPLFYRLMHDHVETTEKSTASILDHMYKLKYENQVMSLEPDKITYNKDTYAKWRRFELTN